MVRDKADKLCIMLCCNNPDNGMFEGYVESITIELACGESIKLNGPRVKVSEKAAALSDGRRFELIKIGRVTARKFAGASWVGNWCWDSVTINSEKARQVINYLKKREWLVECSPVAFYDRWKEAGEITLDEWPVFVNLGV